MRVLQDITLADANAERVRRDRDDAIRELQRLQPRIVANVALADGIATEVPHGLGRVPLWVKESCVRGATSTGRIVETRDGIDRTKAVKLTASGWGATITVDVLFQ